MDDDPVLRELGEELARDDPRLAALLGTAALPATTRPRRHHGRNHGRHRGRLLVVAVLPVVLAVALLVPPTVALGATAMLLAVASPLIACWFVSDGGSAPHAR
ncbi:DUF3040 domain-containing protein [Blastococcus litoris]|uniref:DUF3040 domain-containing protein n=1 Tax=Blastococcus litoris TaxID=2171622 RepID=UPI000E307A34|nr:DUF3040 domain-containing protein [Blastococcus litoris]